MNRARQLEYRTPNPLESLTNGQSLADADPPAAPFRATATPKTMSPAQVAEGNQAGRWKL